MRKTKNNRAILYRFCVYQIRALVSNTRGKPIYMSSFDKIVEDIYGVKKFSRRIATSYDDDVVIHLIDRVGLQSLCKLLQSSKFCAVITDMINIDNDISELKRSIRKARDKGKPSKNLAKEYNYLTKLYCKGIKNIKKHLGIKDGRYAYKHKYAALRDFAGKNGYYDDEGMWNSSFMDFNFYDDDYDSWYDEWAEDDSYDDDDYSDSNKLQDFLRQVENISKAPNNRRGRRSDRNSSDILGYADYDPFSDDDDDQYDDYNESAKINKMDDKLSQMTDAIRTLSKQMNSMNQQPYQNNSVLQHQQVNSNNIDMRSLYAELKNIKTATRSLVDAVEDIQDWRTELNNALVEDDYDYSDDVVEYSSPKKTMSNSDIVNQINNSQPVDSAWTEPQSGN